MSTPKETVEAFLAQVAEAVADLLADGDFNFVRFYSEKWHEELNFPLASAGIV